MKKLIIILFTAVFFPATYLYADMPDFIDFSSEGKEELILTFVDYIQEAYPGGTYNTTLRKKFKPITNKQFDCVAKDDKVFCDFVSKENITLKGTITLKYDESIGACEGDVLKVLFTPDNEKYSFLNDVIVYVSDTPFKQKTPKWFQDHINGELKYTGSLKLTNKSIFRFDVSPCSAGNGLYYANITLDKLLEEKVYPASHYKKIFPEYDNGFTLNTNDSYVNLRKSPNGEIITKIYVKDSDNIIIYGLDTINNWHKVIYFPPNSEDYIVGYIHESQIKKRERK